MDGNNEQITVGSWKVIQVVTNPASCNMYPPVNKDKMEAMAHG